MYAKTKVLISCITAEADQHLCFLLVDSEIFLVSLSKISSLWLAAIAWKTCLCLT